jgi:putative SOS response-associated peptidase YedK
VETLGSQQLQPNKKPSACPVDEYEPGIYSCGFGRLAARENLAPTTHGDVIVLTRSDATPMTAAAWGKIGRLAFAPA